MKISKLWTKNVLLHWPKDKLCYFFIRNLGIKKFYNIATLTSSASGTHPWTWTETTASDFAFELDRLKWIDKGFNPGRNVDTHVYQVKIYRIVWGKT